MEAMEATEPDIPEKTLDSLDRYPFGNVLSTTAGLGMPLKPKEFQHMVLSRMGRPQPEWDIARSGCVFPHTSRVTDVSMGEDQFLMAIARVLQDLIGERSGFLPPLRRRVVKILVVRPHVDSIPPEEEVSTPLMRKIGAAWNGYRQRLLSTAELCAPAIEKNAELMSYILDDDLDDPFFGRTKEAGVGKGLWAILGLAPATYLLSAHLKKKERQSEDLGAVQQFIATHPGIAAATSMGVAQLALRRFGSGSQAGALFRGL